MKAMIKCLDPDGVAVDFETEEIKLGRLIPLIPQIKAELVKAGYELVDTHPAQAVEAPHQPADQPLFAVDKIVATVDSESEKVYWRVKGAQFQKYGVIIYPEVLEAAGLGELDPLKPFDGTGWMATYSLKENGKPKKVIRLSRS